MPVQASFFGLPGGRRIALSPWSAQRMDADTLAALEQRASELGVIVSTILRSDRQWMIRLNGGGRSASLVARGPLEAVITGAMDDWESNAYTAEELLTIASQSGVAVRRG